MSDVKTETKKAFEELAMLFRGYALANKDEKTVQIINPYEEKYQSVIDRFQKLGVK